MELWKKQKKILAAFGVFLGLMFLCTLISRAVYASGLPQVTAEAPVRMALDHTVETEGIVNQGREYAVTALAGLRVRTVYVQVGERVTAETLLFDLDTEDLEEKIQEQKLAIQKLQLEIGDLQTKRSLSAQEKEMENARAREDYDRTAAESGENVNRAREDLEAAEDAYEAHKDSPVNVTSEEDRALAQEAYDQWVSKEAELRSALETAQAEYEAAQTEETKAAYEEAKNAYDAHAANPVSKPDFTAEDEAKAAWDEKKASLKDAVEEAGQAVEAAEQSQSDSLLEAERKVEDAGAADPSDSSLEISNLELTALKNTLADYQEILDAGGQVYPDAEGIVTRIQVSSGERVPDGAAVVYADMQSPLQFHVTLTKDQKKYVNQGDTAEIVLGNSGAEEVPVDYVAENESDPELYDVYLFLPEGTGTIGESGTFRVKAQSETYSVCVPIDALHEDSNKRNYVYVVSEREGILGKELAAEQIYVNVLDQNDRYAAIEEGVIDRETQVIVSSTEPLEDRDVIRYKE